MAKLTSAAKAKLVLTSGQMGVFAFLIIVFPF
jgi:hypothetical protein